MVELAALSQPPAGLFWSAPLASDSEFTVEDPLALDYLGQQVGLWLFRGFTTRTSRAQNYVVILYGLHLAEQAVQKFGYPGDDDTRTQLFERWERFWALATLEYRDGRLPRGDEDAMRGVRGASRAWFAGSKPLPLDFPLISRQSELGGLGAYLTSLRDYGLVFPGSLRVTPAATDMLRAFWGETNERDWSHLYEDYALQALRLDRSTIERSSGRLTLRGLGERSRLSSLVHRQRRAQQDRLYDALFLKAKDSSTLPLATSLAAASKDGVTDAEPTLHDLLAGRWGTLTDENRQKVDVALAFGNVARELLGRFDDAYGYVADNGWVADFNEVARASFAEEHLGPLREACAALLETHDARRFRRLQFHGPPLMVLLQNLEASGPSESLQHLLSFHRAVQRSRRGGGSWLQEEQGKLVLQVASYTGYKTPVDFPGFKLNVVRQLLWDLGRLA